MKSNLNTIVMKLSKFLLTALLFVAFSTTRAQTNTSTTAQQTPLPDWGVAGYDNARYYYIPAAETYYDIQKQKYVYIQDGKWTKSDKLPAKYAEQDLYNTYKVVITDNSEPYTSHPSLRAKYPISYKGEVQVPVKPKKTN